ncbi:hypothetical protein [Nocardioides sp. AE5]|uniref:hypothetical protein n=1 Tax=Nocardioides sp. AE5 TaxID=2962573 RepID=UPI002882319C|nr:hypothetical protein [Nocardioides sp. AE5]MDT0202083.1 hypothetical protein [Nocardioides sp. AE5]
MTRLARSMLVAVLGLVVLTGCGGEEAPDPESEASPSATDASRPAPEEPTVTDTDFGAPADGAAIAGTGHAYRLPEGWGDISETALALDVPVDSAAAEEKPTGGFQDNVTVLVQDVPAGTTLDDLEAAVPGQLLDLVPELEQHPRVVLEGHPALHHSGMATQDGTNFFLDEYVVLADTTVTTITFSFSDWLAPEKRDAVANGVLASWQWK